MNQAFFVLKKEKNMVEYLYPLFNEHPNKEVFIILSLFGLLKTAFKTNTYSTT